MNVHLVDGTYELFRAYYGVPGSVAPNGREVGATLGLGASLLSLVRSEGATHVAVAFDHVVESFRNDLFPGYKTGEGIEPELMDQFELAERMTRALGMVAWPMVEFEADDALGTAAARFAGIKDVDQIIICSPDKDFAQSVRGRRVVRLDRRRRRTLDEAGVKEQFGIPPASIPDWLALVGDRADGIPGLRGWGPKSASIVLAEYGRLERIPEDPSAWACAPPRPAALGATLQEHRDDALLYRTLATLREDVPLPEALDDLQWRGAPRAELEALCEELGNETLLSRVPRFRD